MNSLSRRFTILIAFVSLFSLTGCPILFGPPVAGQTRTFDGIEFQWCPPGTFAMGSPMYEVGRNMDEPLHEVTLSEGFWLSKYPITQAQWENITGTNPSNFAGADKPVENVSWDDVQDFLIYLNASSANAMYRLPTEAEWEYAYRAGTTTRFYWGDDSSLTDIDNYAWYDTNEGSQTHPVGQKLPNAWGLYDMAGNVEEWCQDTYGTYPAGPVTDPQGPPPGNSKVLRGGAYNDDAVDVRAAARDFFNSDSRLDIAGFRLVRTTG